MSASLRERSAPWIEGALLALVVLAILACSGDAVRASYHGYLHVTVGEAVLREGLTPENPYHAGAPLRYYTLYPALGVLLGRTGIGPWWGFVALNVLAAFLLAPALDALARACGLSFVARRAAFLAAVLGFNALGWTGFLAVEDLRFGAAPVYALQPLCYAGRAFGWDARLQAFLPKFLNVSSFALALPFASWALAAAFGRYSTRRILLAGLALGLSTALNPLAGLVAAVGLAAGVAPAFVRGTKALRLAWLAAAVLAGLVALPFLLPALASAPHGPSLTGNPNLGGSPLANWIGPLALVLPLGVLGFMRMASGVRWRLSVVLLLCAALVLVGEMPQGNEYKLERMGALLWALPAGVLLGEWWSAGPFPRRKALVCLVVATPTFALVPWAYLEYGAQGPELPLVVRDHGRLRPPEGPSATAPYFVAGQSSLDAPRAVVVMNHFEPGTRLPSGLVQGNAFAPALDHALFVDLPQIHNEGQPDLERRLDLVAAFYDGERSRPRDGVVRTRAAALAELRAVLPDRPYLFFVREGEPSVIEILTAAGAVECARASGSVLFRLAPIATAVREDR
ncbi:MAG: hypothetical protein HZA53_13645 [Planctomycetes bacterium]|nr:hypothetical protein [Planctomycetota bacterium]